MLVLSRRINEKIVFPGINATIQVVAMKPGLVRLGIEAPDSVPVFREEVLQRSEAPPPAAVSMEELLRELNHVINNRLSASMVGLALLRRQLEMGQTQDMATTLNRLDQDLQTFQQRLGRITDPVRESAVAADKTSGNNRRRALLVEDDGNERELLAGFLRLAGVTVETASDGADALDVLRHQERPDVVLLDMQLPRCDGPTMVRTLRSDPTYSGLRIFGVTGAKDDNFGLTMGPNGIDRWFRKPLNPEYLLRELEQLWTMGS